jgi:multisubunit Na+/H+ antiporter MnhB subunit
MTVMTRALARLLLPVTMMVAAAILIKGYADVGDGFSAGIIASLGVLLQYVSYGPALPGKLAVVRHAPIISLVGLAISLSVTFLPVFFGDPVMTHWPPPGEHVIHFGSLELISAVAFDIGVFLLVFGFAVGVIDLIARTIERERT